MFSTIGCTRFWWDVWCWRGGSQDSDFWTRVSFLWREEEKKSKIWKELNEVVWRELAQIFSSGTVHPCVLSENCMVSIKISSKFRSCRSHFIVLDRLIRDCHETALVMTISAWPFLHERNSFRLSPQLLGPVESFRMGANTSLSMSKQGETRISHSILEDVFAAGSRS